MNRAERAVTELLAKFDQVKAERDRYKAQLAAANSELERLRTELAIIKYRPA